MISPPQMRIHCKLVPVQYREYEYGLFPFLRILLPKFGYPHFVIRILSSAFFHPHFIIRFFYPPSAIRRHPVRTLQRPEISETFPGVFCFPKSRINENGDNPEISCTVFETNENGSHMVVFITLFAFNFIEIQQCRLKEHIFAKKCFGGSLFSRDLIFTYDYR